ncbi:hypothetical protein CLM82_31735, partial [Streptomyces albidoflavus]
MIICRCWRGWTCGEGDPRQAADLDPLVVLHLGDGAVRGSCVGGGAQLAAACDLRFAEEGSPSSRRQSDGSFNDFLFHMT